MDKERKRYKLRCPNCGYTYEYEGQLYEWENCPMLDCGYKGKFDFFVVEIVDIPPDRGVE